MDHGKMQVELQHREITERIIGSAFEVYRVLGYGLLESVYQRAMQVELMKAGRKAEIERPIKVNYKGNVVGDYRADILVDDVVVIELKTAKEYNAEDEPQLLNELKAKRNKSRLVDQFWADQS